MLATAITSCVETTTKLPTAQDLQTTGSKCVLTAVMKTSNVNPTISSAFPLPVRARALFDYEGNECTDLSFKRNEIITIRQQTDANWCIGELNGKQGFLPISFVQVIEEMNASKRASGHLHTMITAAASNAVVTLPRPLPNAGRPLNGNSNDATNLAHAPQRTHNVTTIVPMASNNLTHSTTATAVNTNTSATTNSIMNVNLMSLQQMQITSPMCRALYDFRVADVADKSCLCFAKHDLILFIRKVDDNWAEGRIGNRVGIFPISFVEMLPPGSTSTSTQSASRTLNMNELAGISNHKPMKAVENQSLSNTCSGTDTEDEARRTSYSNGTDESIRLTATTNKITFSAGNARSNSLNSTTMIPSGPQNRPPPPYAIAANSSNLIVASRATAGGCIANTAVASDCLPLQTSNANAIYETLIGTTTSSSSTPALTNKRHSLCLLPGAPAIPRLCSKSTRSNKSTYGCSLATNENTLNAFQSLELLTDAAIKGNSSSTRQPSVANNSNSFDNLLSIRSNASLELYVCITSKS